MDGFQIGPCSISFDSEPVPYPQLVLGEFVEAGSRWTWDEVSYEAIQSHDALWEPPLVPALFKPYREPFALWVQPLGSEDAYKALDDDGFPTTCTHDNQRWVNVHGDGNVWEPGVFGWERVERGDIVASIWTDAPKGESVAFRLQHVHGESSGPGKMRAPGGWKDWPSGSGPLWARWPA